MTYEEAYQLLPDFDIVYYGNTYNEEYAEKIRTKCYEALEKQIPKKPIDKQIVNDGRAWQYICPCCNMWQVSTEKSHCGDCGQALDWRDKMTCKDCIHYDVCYDRIKQLIDYGVVEKECAYFKDKSKIIELPCKVGEDCYKVLSELKMIVKSKLETVDLIGNVMYGLITTDKSKAEAKLKELNR